MSQRTLLVTTALPYANGPLHFGHLTEQIQADVWVRAMRLAGHSVRFVCADDTHGTPIMLKAEAEGLTPEALIAQIQAEHEAAIAGFGISFDHYSSTHSDSCKQLVERIYKQLRLRGHISTREVEQFFDPERQMFLPDRFIKGTCPKCAAKDQYGDGCEVCGSTYTPTDLLEPYSVVSGARPVRRSSEHYFFKLGDFETMLTEWVRSGRLQEEVANKLDEWFKAGLKDWDISRDAPYFGFEIPGAKGKYFYVWLDAPIGYLGALQELAARDGLDFESWLAPHSDAELVHFIGKDILYFHTLFWPAVLHAAGLRTPTLVHAHGFLTVDGQKMSKSRGTFVTAAAYLERFAPDYLRYYLAAKLGPSLSDLDLNLAEFATKVNADLVGKVVNLASRCAGFIHKRFDGQLADSLFETALQERFVDAVAEVRASFEARDAARAIRQIMQLADEANRFIDEHKPWVLAKDESRLDELHRVCTQGLNLFRVLIGLLKPVIPFTADKAEAFLQSPLTHFDALAEPLLGRAIAPFEPLLTRLEAAQTQALVASAPGPQEASGVLARSDTRASEPATTPEKPPKAKPSEPERATIGIEDFSKVELRIARIVEAESVPEADKLLRLLLDIGSERRQVFAGIKKSYDPATLVGRLTVMVANLAPRKMRFGLSEGMVLAASDERGGPYLLSPDAGAEPGMRVS
ncbi:MAG: methionine--tRNA ligase [Xanthomonadales bacterium]|nr:methionine--tRNA ligase [Xanthomonadales bacterium]